MTAPWSLVPDSSSDPVTVISIVFVPAAVLFLSSVGPRTGHEGTVQVRSLKLSVSTKLVVGSQLADTPSSFTDARLIRSASTILLPKIVTRTSLLFLGLHTTL